MKAGVASAATAVVCALAGSAWAAGDGKACLEGDKKACIEIGKAYANQPPVGDIDEMRAKCEKTKDEANCAGYLVEEVKAGCRDGKEAACKTLGESEARDIADEAMGTTEDLEASCKRKKQQACVDLAVRLFREDPSAETVKRAVSLLERACKGGAADGCARLGMVLLFNGKESGAKRGLKLMKRSCAMGSKAGCEFERNFKPPAPIKVVPDNEAQGPGILGVLKTTEDPDFETRQLARLATLLERNCKLGYADACAELEEPEAAEKRKILTSSEVAAKIRKLNKQAHAGPGTK